MSFATLFSFCCWPTNCLALCSPLPHCPVLSATCTSCIICSSPTHCVFHHLLASLCLPPTLVVLSTDPLAPYIIYLDLNVAFILHSLPPLPCCLSQRPLNATSTMEPPCPSLPLNTVLTCHCHHLPCCPLPLSTTPCCCSHQMPSLLPPPFAIFSSSVTTAAFPVIHHHHQTPPPAIATCCHSHQMPSLPPPPFAILDCYIH
jgi:hypothetical protein